MLKTSYVAHVTAMSEDIVKKQISQEKLINKRNNIGNAGDLVKHSNL